MYSPNNPNGSATSANSAPVVIASDQGAIPVATHTVNIGTPGTLATDATLALIKAKTDNLDVLLSSRTKPADTQPVSAASLPLPALAATSTKQSDGTQKSQTVDASGNILDVPLEGATFANTLRGTLLYGREAGTGAGAVAHSLVTNAGGILKTDNSAVTQPVSAASLPLPAGAAAAAKQPALGTAGTPSADVITVQGVASGTPQPVSAASIEQPALSAGALNADLVAATDVSAYRALSIHILGTYVGTLTFQGSNDNTNWVSVELTNQTTGGLTATTSSTGVLYIAAVAYRYFRCRMTAWTSGSATGVAEFYTLPVSTISTAAVQSGSWTVQPGNNANTTAWKVDGSAVTQPVSLTSVPSHAVTNAGVFATQPTAAATGGYTPAQLISAATTNATIIKASAGTLGYITASNINAAPRYLKIYNKASAPTVGTDTPVHTFLIPGNTAGAGTNIPLPPQGIALGTGIAIAITTGVAVADTAAVAASEIVVNYGTV